ncbi:hypothetical protein H5410_060212 [Solanum commersonii]|uniref:DUF4283 domain-containing protein n=1 Tax=Solanum commersonii TaxID=4109 RepID=A0A9J5W5V1_SOLCO|nr:hypothetical protein H5410_060212 [Solanum commersonii]
MARSEEIQVQRSGEGDSQSKDLHNTQKSIQSTFPFARNREAISWRLACESPQSHLQERGSFDEIRAENFNGDYSHVLVEHLTKSSSNIKGEINGNIFSGNLTGAPANHDNEKQRNEEDVEQQPNNSNDEKGDTCAKIHIEDRDRGLMGRTVVAPVHSVSNAIEASIRKAHLHNHANEHNIVHKEQEQHNTQVWQAKQKQQHPPSRTNVDQTQSGNGYPKVSSNFNHQISSQRNRFVLKTSQPNEKYDQPTTSANKKEHIPEPAPYTVVQTYAARLRHNQSKIDNSIKLTTPEVTTKQGLPAVLFVKEEVSGPLAEVCKYTLIGKFTHTMPNTQLLGGVKIAHYNARHVFIDLDNELDYNTVWSKQRMSIAGQLIRIQAWTPSFKPEVETPIVHVWVTLPDLPWHCYNKDYVSGLLLPVGKVLYLDSDSIQKTRGSKAKVKVQIDLTKKRPPYVWIGYIGEDITDGRWQTIEYEDVPPYCFHYMHQGHIECECSIKQRDEDHKRKGELEDKRKNKSSKDSDENSRTEIINNTSKAQSEQKEDHQQEEQWKIQRKKHNNQQPPLKGMKKSADHQHLNQSGMNSIPTHNIYIDLDIEMQEQPSSSKEQGNADGNTVHNKTQSTNERPNEEENNKIQQQAESLTIPTKNRQGRQSTSGIDSKLPSPKSLINVDKVVVGKEADGGMEGRVKEKTTNLQDGKSKGGRELTYVLHEVSDSDHRCDYRAPATPSTQNRAEQ